MSIFEWFRARPTMMGWIFVASVVAFLASLIVIPVIVARMPANYFVSRKPPAESWRGQHGALRIIGLIVKNFVGLVLLLAGITMLVLPGQGIITILVGLSLLDFPGKRRLELSIVRQRPVFQAINWIRERAKRPPLELPDAE